MSEPLDRAEEAQATGPRPNRIFVGLKMAPETAVSLAALAERIDSVPLRRVAPNDIHLTLVPPWDETSIPAAVRRLSKGVTGFEFPSLSSVCATGLSAAALASFGPNARHAPSSRRCRVCCSSLRPGMRGYQVVVSSSLGALNGNRH